MYKFTIAAEKITALKKRVRVIQGGTSAGKTVAIIIYLIHLSQADKNQTLTSIVSESFPHLRRGCLREFLLIMKEHNYFKEKNWNSTNFIYTFETGSQIEFFSVDQADKVRGARRDRLFINEANNVSFDAFEQLEVRTKEFIFLDYNPTSEFWAFTEIPKRNDWEKIVLTYKDNEALSKEIIDSIEQRRNRGGWWKVYGLGELGEIEGRIYTNWKIIDEIPHEARLERYGLDFGYTNDPSALVAICYYNGGYILDEKFYQRATQNRDIAALIKNYPSALTIADSAEPKSIDDIKSYGINIIGAKKRAEGFGVIGTYLKWSIGLVQEQKISVTKNSVNLIKEYRNYLWQVDRDGRMLNTPEEGNDHALDAIRYAMTTIVPIIRRQELISALPVINIKQKPNRAR